MPKVVDSFDRADSSTLGTSDSGHAWSTPSGFVSLGITGNQCYGTTAGSCLGMLNPGFSDVDAQVTLSTRGAGSDDAVGIAFRMVSDSDTRGMYFRTVGTTKYELLKYWTGSPVTVRLGEGGVPANGDVLRVIAIGPHMRCYLNGSLLIEATDSWSETGVRHGIQVYTAADARLDDFTVDRAKLPAPVIVDYQANVRASVW